MAKDRISNRQQEVKQIAVRLPKVLHDALWQRRLETGQSLNDLLIEAAAKFVGIPVPPLVKGVPGPKRKQGLR